MSEDVKKSASTEHESEPQEVVESAEETETSKAQHIENEPEIQETEAVEETTEAGGEDESLDADAEAVNYCYRMILNTMKRRSCR